MAPLDYKPIGRTDIPEREKFCRAHRNYRAETDPAARAWQRARLVTARGTGLASVLAAVVLGVWVLARSYPPGLDAGALRDVRLVGLLGIAFAVPAGLLLMIDRLRPQVTVQTRLPLWAGIGATAAIVALVTTPSSVRGLPADFVFLGETSPVTPAVLALVAGALAWLCLMVASSTPLPDPERPGSTDRRAGLAGAATVVVWALVAGLLVGVQPAAAFDSTTTDRALSGAPPLDTLEVAYDLRLPTRSAWAVHPIAGGFLTVGSTVTAYDGSTGEYRWHFGFGQVWPHGGGGQSAVTVRRDGHEVVVTERDFTVVLDAVTGRVVDRSLDPGDRADSIAGATSALRYPVESTRSAFSRPGSGDRCVPARLEVGLVEVTPDCARRNVLYRVEGAVRTEILLDVPTGHELTDLQSVGDGLLALSYRPAGQPVTLGGIHTVVTVVLDVLSGTEVDRFETAQEGEVLPVLSRPRNGTIGVVESGRSTVEVGSFDFAGVTVLVRDLHAHRGRQVTVPMRAEPVDASPPVWAGDDLVVLGYLEELARIDTAAGDTVRVQPVPCRLTDAADLRVKSMLQVPGALLIRCASSREVPDTVEIVGLR